MRAVGQLVSLIAGILLLPASSVLLVVAVTWEGRAVATGAFLAVGAMLIAAFGRAQTRIRRRWIAAGMGLVAVALFSVVLSRAPSGVTPSHARVRHLYTDGQPHSRWSVANVVPEIDQLMMGFALMPFIDPLLTHRQAAPLKRSTREIYQELEADSEFRALGSVMSHAYTELRGGDIPRHAFLYVPANLDRSQPAPVLLFFHGSGGNFKAYLWLLSKLGDRMNMVVIAPTFGMGNWTARETHTRITAAFAEAERFVSLDRGRVHAVGLSNGGRAVSHLLGAASDDHDSLVFLSPVFHDKTVRNLSYARGDRTPAILVATGALDDRVPLSYVEERVAELRRFGRDVTLESFADANHFLLFSHRAEVLSLLERWLTRPRPSSLRTSDAKSPTSAPPP